MQPALLAVVPSVSEQSGPVAQRQLKVEELLLSNIREWSFVEAQVLEPTVRVHAPEILVPLQHLTSSLEMLGHYYVMRDQLASGEVRLRGEPELDRTELDPELKLYSNRIESR